MSIQDHEKSVRIQEALDSLPNNPLAITDEQAEAVLQACGTSGKDVVNGFIDRLLRERSSLLTERNALQAEVARLSTLAGPDGATMLNELVTERDALRAECERLRDLARYCRHQLLDENLITQEEFTRLLVDVGDHGKSVARLESYDTLRQKLAQAEERVRILEQEAELTTTDIVERAAKLSSQIVLDAAADDATFAERTRVLELVRRKAEVAEAHGNWMVNRGVVLRELEREIGGLK